MVETSKVTISGKNFHNNLSAGLFEALLEEDMVDVTLAAEGFSINCHRLVLSIASETLKTFFDSKPPNAQAFVYLHNVSPLTLQHIVKFIYCGEVSLENEDLAPFMSAAISLKIKGLAEQIKQESGSRHSPVGTTDGGLGGQTSAGMGTGTTTTDTEVTTNKRRAAKRRRIAGSKMRTRATHTTTSTDLQEQQILEINDADTAPTRSSARNKIETLTTNLDDGTAESGIETQQQVQTETPTTATLDSISELPMNDAALEAPPPIMAKYVQSQSGRQFLIQDKFLYVYEKTYSNKLYWHCNQNNRTKCRARLHTIDDQIIYTSKNRHNHPPPVNLVGNGIDLPNADI